MASRLPEFPPGHFQCPTCKELKHVSQFHKNKSYITGHHYNCKKCRKEFARVRNLKNRCENYGITLERAELLMKQMCQICNKRKGCEFDHDHSTGKLRGVICSGCNAKLAWLENYGEKITNYLEKDHDLILQ